METHERGVMAALARLARAPRFEDAEKSRVAAMLHALLWLILAGTLAWPISLAFVPSDHPTLLLVLDAGVIGAIAGSWYSMRHGRIVLASAVLVGVLWAAVVAAIAAQGLASPSVNALLGVLVLAGILLGVRGVVVASAAGLVALAAVYAATLGGMLSPVEVSDSYRWLLDSVLVVFTGAVLAAAAAGHARVRTRLGSSERRFRKVVAALPDGVAALSEDGTVEEFNAAAERIAGLPARKVIGRHFLAVQALPEEEHRRLARAFEAIVRDQDVPTLVTTVRRPDGEKRRVEARVRRTTMRHGGLGVIVVFRDIEDRRRAAEREEALTEQLREAQRLEAIGRLAGGVAHDFNNALTVILVNAGFIEGNPALPDGVHSQAREITQAAEHAASVTRQLLAFGRRQVLDPRPIDLAETIAELEPMLRRVCGEGVTLEVVAERGPTMVLADRTQIAQVALNLAANARDAMPHGGTLTVETRPVEVGPDYLDAHAEIEPGPYVVLAVSDTGRGFDPEHRARAFEPFFTTKGFEGTGLGLATVYGIVKQSDGHVFLYSEPGQGATFKIYLPRVPGEAHVDAAEAPAHGSVPPGTTVLLAEDEPELMSVVRRTLEGHGIRVLAAATADDARQLCQEHDGPIHLLVTDVVMPDVTGPELAAELQAIRPGLSVLYTSGYASNAIVHHGVLDDGVHFIGKPYTSAELIGKIAQVLSDDAQ